jgi:hypothetical protein
MLGYVEISRHLASRISKFSVGANPASLDTLSIRTHDVDVTRAESDAND